MKKSDPSWGSATRLAHAGRDPSANRGLVNLMPARASTVIFETVEAYLDPVPRRRRDAMAYGRIGTAPRRALEQIYAEMEGSEGAIALPSGVAAISLVLDGLLRPGDHLIMVDCVYKPARKIAELVLAAKGVETSFLPPRCRDLGPYLRPTTKLLYLESPGSHTFELQDIGTLAAQAHAAGAQVAVDNTWATPLYCRPLELGADLIITSGTKYIVGHSDAMLGLVAASGETETHLRRWADAIGHCPGSEELYLALRGLRTLEVRLPRHQASALEVARWLETRPEVAEVRHPALESHPDHALWKRDFGGACGLFGVCLEGHYSQEAADAMVNSLELFGIGASWGGYESLVAPTRSTETRTAEPWSTPGPAFRLHIGLEDPKDLIRDLEAGFRVLRAERE